ncbi:MAG TPA: C39 family peptidase [Marmoricola sp.]|nr:C39 family peptidase [Marmoricola sp.]
MSRVGKSLCTAALALITAGAGVLVVPPANAAGGSSTTYTALTGKAAWNAGTHLGTAVSSGRLVLSNPSTTTVDGVTYKTGTWTSGWITPGQAFSEAIPSWSATTPAGTWLKISLSVRKANGTTSSFDTLASWASGDKTIKRRSWPTQYDDFAYVNTDTLATDNGVAVTAWQVRIDLFKRPTAASPSVQSIGVAASAPGAVPTTSTPSALAGKQLGVPAWSQMRHKGHYPEYGGGGEAWCSPTALAMAMAYFGALPNPRSWSWVKQPDLAPWVDHTARMTYDYAYKGTGNWSFNTAFAAQTLPTAYVSRLRDLTEVERYIAAGIPVTASISFGAGQLTGSPIRSSRGHLVVIIGTTSNGRVIVNDPAAPTDTGVRRIYRRAEFERAWLGRSHGTVYLLTDAAHPLPNGPTEGRHR